MRRAIPVLLVALILLVPILKGGQQHDPISINGDQELLQVAEQEGWPGDGSPENPIVVQGLDIDAEGGPYALYIGNTTLHVVVRECVFRGARSNYLYWGGGLVLHNVTNLVFEDSEVRDADRGVVAYKSRFLTVRDLTLSAEYSPIVLGYSNNITISGITVQWAKWYGLSARRVENVTIEDFTALLGDIGIYVTESNSVSVSATISNHSYSGIYVSRSRNIRIHDVVASASRTGITLYYTGESVIERSNFSNNTLHGISLEYSENITVRDSVCNHNGNNGIYLKYTENSVIVGNTCNWNENYHGMSLDKGSSGNLIAENSITGNAFFGIYLYEGGGNVLRENRLVDNRYGAIAVIRSSGCRLWSNEMVHGGVALLSDSVSDLVSHEMPENNTVNGKPLRYVKSAYGGTVPPGAGQVIVALSQSVVVEGQEISDTNYGILVIGSSYVTVRENILSGQPINGIFLIGATHVTLRNNRLEGCGVTVIGSDRSHYDSHDIDESNSVNGKPLAYVSGAEGVSISGAGQVIVASSSRVSITGDLGYSNVPLTIAYSEDVSYSGTISGAGSYGVIVHMSSRVDLDVSILGGNVYVESSDNVTIAGEGISDFDYGIIVSNSDNVSVLGMRIANMTYGIYVQNSKAVSVTETTITDCWRGMELRDSSIRFENNTVAHCESFAFWVLRASGTIRNNNFLYNNGSGDEYDENHIQAHCMASDADIRWNFWSDLTGPDEDGDGYVDVPYRLDGSCQDSQPRAEPVVPEFPL